MSFQLPHLTLPDFSVSPLAEGPYVSLEEAPCDGVAPEAFYLTTHVPTWYHCVHLGWTLPQRSSLNCVAVQRRYGIEVVEIRDLRRGDLVVCGNRTDGSEGIFVCHGGFPSSVSVLSGRSAESSSSADYHLLFDLMRHERDTGGSILWVLGPSVVFDYDTRIALSRLATQGYVNALLAGNALATHDLEGGYLDTALGQNIYTQQSVPLGHYNHLDLLNEVRRRGTTRQFIEEGHVKDGFIKTLCELRIPIVLAGSIRDDGPLPEVHGPVSQSLTAMKELTDKATLIICLATMLHSVATVNLASSYRITDDGSVVPLYLYSIDVTENVNNKIAAARDYTAVRTLVTNVQDFVVNVQRGLAALEKDLPREVTS